MEKNVLIRSENSRTHSGRYAIGLMILLLGLCLFSSCRDEKKPHINMFFQALGPEKTGLNFSNDLHYDKAFNLFKYIYFYNGAGVGAADFNNDGRIDLFFGSNQGSNKLFLNKGDFRFEDVSSKALIPEDGGWTTGISVVDINNDGLMDIYICRVGEYETLHSRNLLLVNQGPGSDSIPRFKEMAAEFGLDFKGFSTQAAFFDYDLDGDLDMFLLNHSVHENGAFRPRKDFIGTYHPLSGDRMYRNEGGTFTDVTRESGINSSAIGYGLGIAISDINGDGYPDIYIGNDFHENDYLYINQGNGRFSEESASLLQHTSQFSMGVDVADVNNDARPEIISVDMLPEDAYILKRSLGEDAYDIFQHKISVGYSHQYARNALQWNRPDGRFSELGLYSGVAATDWSWAPLWVDFNNDGWKDLFVSNGIPKRMNDIDYVNFVSNAEIRRNITGNTVKDKDIELIKKFPAIKLPNKFYLNTREFKFEDVGELVNGASPGFSNGAAYADLNNDGSPDVVVNNIDAPPVIYANMHVDTMKGGVLELRLRGSSQNRQAVGARVMVYEHQGTRVYEKFPVRGFLSSMDGPMLIGLEHTFIDSILLIWPDNRYQRIEVPATNQYRAIAEVTYDPNLPVWEPRPQVPGVFSGRRPLWEEISSQAGLQFIHRENHFAEFDREPLIPHMLSTEGPALAVADINGDGWEDVYIGGASNQAGALYLQNGKGGFVRHASAALEQDSACEDVDAVWADVNGDGFPDLLVAGGGNEYYGKDPRNTPRLYLNDGKGNLKRKADAFEGLFLTASCIAVTDLNGDKLPDLFIGARAEPWAYGQTPVSCLLQNDGTGRFTDVVQQWDSTLAHAGFVTDAKWVDLDADGDEDLLLALEWGPVTAWIREGSKLVKKELNSEKGWWNFVQAVDMDGDGDLDIVAGNLGWNSRLHASAKQPVRLYYNDFDGNGKKEQVMTYYLQGRELPFANKAELEKQMPVLRKKYLYAEQFAKASLQDLLGGDALRQAQQWQADHFASTFLLNNGDGSFYSFPLPWQQQLAPLRAALPLPDSSKKGRLLVMGNYYDNNIQMGRYDADFGSILYCNDAGFPEWEPLQGWLPDGQVRRIRLIRIPGGQAILVARNNGPLSLVRMVR